MERFAKEDRTCADELYNISWRFEWHARRAAVVFGETSMITTPPPPTNGCMCVCVCVYTHTKLHLHPAKYNGLRRNASLTTANDDHGECPNTMCVPSWPYHFVDDFETLSDVINVLSTELNKNGHLWTLR